jgi:hypothetical protein
VKSVGSLILNVKPGNPVTPVSEADLLADLSITDVRNTGTLDDYAGNIQATMLLKITDRWNDPGGGEQATMQDIPFPVDADCTPTAATSIGSACAVSTSINALVPGAIQEGKRAIWELGQIQVSDGGPDGDVTTADNSLFAVQGVFAP